MRLALVVCALAVVSCSSAPRADSVAPPIAGDLRVVVKPVALPGATGAVSLDYLAVDRASGLVWVPAGDTGSVDVIDPVKGTALRVQGFATAERAGHAGKRVVGPSSATIGDGFAYVGDRASSEVCALPLAAPAKGACVTLPVPPDGLAYVATTKEVWATTPSTKSIGVLDAQKPEALALKTTLPLDGEPEGYAVDAAKGVFFTNLEDGDKTLVIDARSRKVTATWEATCGGDGPRGLALDAARGILFVACTDRVKALDVAHAGAELGVLAAGGGVDNIDYVEARAELFVAAGKAGTLTVAKVDDKGGMRALGVATTAPGARVVVAGADGTAFVADGRGGRVLVVSRVP
jgi:DNA-binding beta-propeller fold protein YncE